MLFIDLHSKNVYGNLQSGSRQLGDLKPDAVAALKAGGKSVEELTGEVEIIFILETGLLFDYLGHTLN